MGRWADITCGHCATGAKRMSGDWIVRLGGDDWSLEGLGAWFTQERHRVKQEDGRYYLTSPDLTACGTEDEAWKVAERIVGHINSATRLVEPSFRPVRVEALNRLELDGTRRGSVRVGFDAVVVARERITAEVTRADGTVETIISLDPSLAQKLVRLQEREQPDSPVSRALKQWNLPEQNPNELNNILEIIRHDVSGGDRDKGRAWSAMARPMAPLMSMSEHQLDNELKRCRQSLVDEAAVGRQARHGVPPARPVSNPMSLDQARDFVHRLLRVWLQSKI